MLRDRIALFTMVTLLVLVSLPYLLAVIWSPPGKIFLGSFYNSQDLMVYLSAMRAGARGEWLRTLPFTSEQHDPALFYPFYMLLGHIAPPDITTFHLARLGMVVLLGLSLWRLIGEILPAREERRIAFTLALLSTGFGMVLTLTGLARGMRPVDIFAPTATLFGASIINPHFPLAAVLDFTILALYLRAERAPYRPGTLFAGALACLALGFVLPFNLIVIAAIFLVDGLSEVKRWRRWWNPATRNAFFIFLPGVAPVLYYQTQFRFAPFWGELVAQWPQFEHLLSALDYAVGYGLMALFAALGAVRLFRQSQRTRGERLLLAWFIVNSLLVIAPLDFADRLSLGLSAALAMLTSIALNRTLAPQRWARAALKRFARDKPEPREALPALMALLVLPGVVLQALTLPLFALSTNDLPYYMTADEAAGLGWLARHAQTRDLALAVPAISNLIPAMSEARVYSGHDYETYQPIRKKAEVKWFFGETVSHAERREFLREKGITLVYVEPNAHGAGAFDGDGADYLQPVFRANRVTLFRVVGDGR